MRCGRSRRALARRLLPVFVRGMGGGISFCASGGLLSFFGEREQPISTEKPLQGGAYVPRQNARTTH